MGNEIYVDAQCLCVPAESMRGIPYYTKRLIKAVISNKYDCTICYFDQNRERGNENLIRKNLGEEIWTSINHIECNKYSYRSFMRDIILHGASDFPYYNELWGEANAHYHFPTGQMCPAKIGARAVVTVHDVIPLVPETKGVVNDNNTEYLKCSLESIKKNKNIKIIADSANTKNDLIRLYDFEEHRIFVNLLGCDTSFFKPETDVSFAEQSFQGRYLLYLGAFAHHKGILDVIEAFNLVKSRDRELKLVLAGNKHTADEVVKKGLESSPFRDDIFLTGFVTEDYKRKLMSNATAFLFPSYYEGFGLPVLEAMACGCPVICSNVSSIPEIGLDCVMYVNPGDHKGMADRIIELLDNECIWKQLSAKGLTRARQLTWENHASRLCKLYKEYFEV